MVIMFTTVGVFSQTQPWIFNHIPQYTWDVGVRPYRFTIEDEIYDISYDSLQNRRTWDAKGRLDPEYEREIADRPVYLFRLDNSTSTWVKATEIPIQRDYFIGTIEGGRYKYFISGHPAVYDWRTDKSGCRVTIQKNGIIKISIVNEYSDGEKNGKRGLEIHDVLLVPLGNKMYKPFDL